MWHQEIKESGFAIIPDVLPDDEIAQLNAAMAGRELRRTRAGVRHALSLPVVAGVARDPRMLNIARSVLGNEAAPFRATLFDKSPSSNWLVTWHQDTALPLAEKKEATGWGPWSVKDGVHYAHAPAAVLLRVLALRLHLDDSTAANGPLRVLPATHKLGVLTDEAIERLAVETQAVECVVAKGSVVAMRPLIVHASSKSKSDNPRRVLHIEYSASLRAHEELQLATA